MVEFSGIPEVLEDLKKGKMIVLVDDEDRENEGDLVCAAELTTPEIINFMVRQAGGLICLPMTGENAMRSACIRRLLKIPQSSALRLPSVSTRQTE
jgi:3,4-dihydroxy-2-butanone 4-phosphate synthase